MALSLDAWKGLSMVVFTVISIVGAAIAVLMKERARQLYVTCGVLFSAGILLAGGFVHLLKDSAEQFAEMEGGEDNFPWAFAISGITIVGLSCVEIMLDRGLENYMNGSREGKYNSPSVEADTIEESQEREVISLLEEESQGQVEEAFIEQGHDHDHLHPNNSFTAIILTAALSIHSILEGLGIGASRTVSELTTTFIAVACHKGFTAFALAEGMVSSGYWKDIKKRKYFYLSVGTFVVVSLIGIAIGWAASGGGEESAVTAVLIGITSGSFIYVPMMEILPQEKKIIKSERLMLLPTIFFFVAGYCLMTLLAVWV